jgi:hypothetical protein
VPSLPVSQDIVVDLDCRRCLILLRLGLMFFLQFIEERGQAILLPGRKPVLLVEVQVVAKPFLIRPMQAVWDQPDLTLLSKFRLQSRRDCQHTEISGFRISCILT